MNFSKKVRHTCTVGAWERWVSDDPDWVLFNNQSLTIKLHKIYIYVNVKKSMGARKKILAFTNKTILHGGTMTFSKKARHTCTLGGTGEMGERRPRLGAPQAPLTHYQDT